MPALADPACSTQSARPPALPATLTPILDTYLETRTIGVVDPAAPCLVFLHEGLGSAATWRDFPDALCERTGSNGLVYSRRGYGASTSLEHDFMPDFMHAAATVELPALLEHFGIEEPILVGHSDGASIALLFGALGTSRSRAIIAIAPHLFVEEITTRAIATLASRVTSDPSRLDTLSQVHRDARRLFERWTRAWSSHAFSSWNIEQESARIRCPVLAVQGDRDQYGTLEQIGRLVRCAPGVRSVVIPECRHSPHLECPDRLLDICAAFIAETADPQDPIRRTE